MRITAMAGQMVTVPLVIYERLWHEIHRERMNVLRGTCFRNEEVVEAIVPQGQTHGVGEDEYHAYRRGLYSATADCVIQSFMEEQPVVLASQRAGGKVGAGQWWMQGGAIHAYMSPVEFVAQKVQGECGIKVNPCELVLMGFYIFLGEDKVCSTLSPCYVAYVPFDVAQQQLRLDSDHTEYRWMTGEDLNHLPPKETHPYAMRAFKLALKTALHTERELTRK